MHFTLSNVYNKSALLFINSFSFVNKHKTCEVLIDRLIRFVFLALILLKKITFSLFKKALLFPHMYLAW